MELSESVLYRNLSEERAQVSRVIARVRSDLPRADVKAQVVAASIVAVVVASMNMHLHLTPWLLGAGLAAGVALTAALIALWPTVEGITEMPAPLGGIDRLEYEQTIVESRHLELKAVERLARRKFRAVQLAYLAAAVATLTGVVAVVAG